MLAVSQVLDHKFKFFYVLQKISFLQKHAQIRVCAVFMQVVYIGTLLLRFIRNHPFRSYAKFSEKLTFLSPWYAHARVHIMGERNVRVHIRGKEMLVFEKFCVRPKWIIPYPTLKKIILQIYITQIFSLVHAKSINTK